MRSFRRYFLLKEETTQHQNKDWRKSFISLEKGFVPPKNMRPIVEAFLKSGDIELTNDLSKPTRMPKKSLFLVGGPVRDFLLNKTIKDYDLATNATPEQIAHILSNGGFVMSEDKSGKKGQPLDLRFNPTKTSSLGDKKTWFVKGRDSSQDGKVFVISAVVNGEEFEIATFRKDAKVIDGQAEVDFVDNPEEDAARRDLTINAMYIELTKADGENKKLYDPTGKGYHDVKNGVVRAVGKAHDRFQEDKLRILRAIRFHSRFGNSTIMDSEIEESIPKFKHMEGVALERIRDEFLKGLTHPDVNLKLYIPIYLRTGLLNKVFPGVNFKSPEGIPTSISDKKDKPLALAWLLQNNTPETVNSVLQPTRISDGEPKQTGWTYQERRAVVFLLKLKEFSPDKLPEYLKAREATGLTNQQIRDWVDMFNIPGTNKNSRPWWAKQVNKFAGWQKVSNWDNAVKSGKDICANCQGVGCVDCDKGKVHPHMRSKILGDLEIEKFKQD